MINNLIKEIRTESKFPIKPLSHDEINAIIKEYFDSKLEVEQRVQFYFADLVLRKLMILKCSGI